MADTLELSFDLAGELSDNDIEDRAARPPVDPRTLPTRFSLLKHLNLSPAHYFEGCQHDQDDSLASRLGAFASDRKEAFRLGNAIHGMLLLGSRVAVYLGGRRDPRIKAYQEFQKQAAADGCIEILSAREHQLVCGVVDAIKRRDDVMELLFADGVKREQRIDWTWMDKAVRSTPDARVPGKYVLDLKSTISSEPEVFRRQSLRFFYHVQAALYARAMEAAGEARPRNCIVVAVEKSLPRPVTVFRFGEGQLELGEKTLRLWFERLLSCEAANHWPVYAPAPHVVELELDDDEY